MRTLLEKYTNPRTAMLFAPPGEGGSGGDGGGDSGGAGGSGGQGNGAGDAGDDDDGGDDDSGDDDDGDGEPDFSDIFGKDDDEDDDDSLFSDDDTADHSFSFQDADPKKVEAMETNLTNRIKEMKVSTDAIPDDFDPSDKKSMAALLTNVMQGAVRQALGLSMKPTQLAMETMLGQFDDMIGSKIKSATAQMSSKTKLAELIPEVNEPKHKSMILAMDRTLRDQGKNVTQRAAGIRKMLTSMGIDKRKKPESGNGGTAIKTGKNALNSLFGDKDFA